MKIDGRVDNMCLSLFVVETSVYESPRTNQGPLRRTLARWSQYCLGSVHPRDAIDDPCVDQWEVVSNHLPKLINFVGSLSYTSLYQEPQMCRMEKAWSVD